MNVSLRVVYLYHDVDVVEIRVTVENPGFRGTADIYVGTGGLLEAASTLEGFPEDHSDKRELVLGAAGKKFAGGSVRLELPTTRKNR
jgi:hypothetical protein